MSAEKPMTPAQTAEQATVAELGIWLLLLYAD